MKTQWIRSIGCILAVLILSGIMPLAAQDNAERYTTISGVVKDKLNKKKLEYVNVSIPGSSVGTVTNADGEFTLKIPESVQAKDIEASHVGYLNSRIPLKEENPTERIVWLTLFLAQQSASSVNLNPIVFGSFIVGRFINIDYSL